MLSTAAAEAAAANWGLCIPLDASLHYDSEKDFEESDEKSFHGNSSEGAAFTVGQFVRK
jgi:hypothetical protein